MAEAFVAQNPERPEGRAETRYGLKSAFFTVD
jgi:hypothetical protein